SYGRNRNESSEVIFLYGNVVKKTELEVTFHSVPDHIAPEDKDVYIDDNAIDLLDYKGAEGKQLNPNGRVVLEVDIPIEVVESIHYERGMLTVNDYLIGVVSPSKTIKSCESDDFQLPIEPRIKWEEAEIKPEEPWESKKTKPEEPEIKKEEEESIFVDKEEQKGALYGFLGGDLAGLGVGGLASGIQAGLGAGETTVNNFVPLVENATRPALTQSTNLMDNLINIVRHAVENVDEFFHKKEDPDKEPLINRTDADGEDIEQRPIKPEPTDYSPQTDGGNNV
ncbi:unnamed protein product, partial [Hymenolepis diminuta]